MRAPDIIRLTGVTVHGRHGVLEAEQRHPQPFRIDAVLNLSDQARGSETDALEDTVSYAEVAELIDTTVSGESFRLIERLAAVLAEQILRQFPLVEAASVTVHKPEAPMPQQFQDVSVMTALHRQQLSGPSEQAPTPPGHTHTTPTAHVGPYDRISLDELGAEEAPGQGSSVQQPPAQHLRDPDLAAAFPVRSVLALGSNIGDSRATLASAIQMLEEHDDVVLVASSPLAKTRPVGGPPDQRDYLNQVIEVATRLSPHQLLDLAQQIENAHNRIRGTEQGEVRWGPRTLDVDIVTYASAVIDSPRLQVPHPSAAERAFVLLPWSWMDPVALLDGRPIRELAAEADDVHEVQRLDGQEDDGGRGSGGP